ncbi:MAG: PhnA domain-containing protein [Eudoraea sp.]|nr:PhnA domain-containing protein [Eudoraea sp.]MBT8291989.1 PhnA domain-containing protein [Eudoraea sp.]
MESKDNSENLLENGDNVQPIKDLKIKGMPKRLKRDNIIKNIGSINNSYEISSY